MIMIIFGTRPEIIKMAPIIQACRKFSLDHILVHTGQHYDQNMSSVFLNELEVGNPNYYLDVGSGTHGTQTGRLLIALEKVMIKEKPDIVLTEGDTNTTLATGLAAVKLGLPIGHVEAGLRSYDLRMPEEHNRRVVDHLSTYLFAPTECARINLEKENIWGKIFVTGNTVIDSCLKYMSIAEHKSTIMNKIQFKEYCLVTIHREENVDNWNILNNFIDILKNVNIPIVFPIHPRTLIRLKKGKLYHKTLKCKTIQILPAVNYFDFLLLMKNSKFIMTDSGGIQEEVTSPNIRKYVFILRDNTERPETIKAGFAEIVGTETKTVLQKVNNYIDSFSSYPRADSPFGDGKAGIHIINILKDFIKAAK